MNHLDLLPGSSAKSGAGRWWFCAVLLGLLAVVVGLTFLREPGFGDDLTYWTFAFSLQERGLKAWQSHSFHELRWPVWGVCWLIQRVFGSGLLSFYGEAFAYLAAGALLTFSFGRKVTDSLPTALFCGALFLFHPLLDTVCYRPMPDLSESVWGAAVMLAWWSLMCSESRSRSILLAIVLGGALFTLEANRITGVFVLPILGLCSVLFFRRRLHWLVLAGVFAAIFYSAEGLFYRNLFGDFLHDIHANLGNKGAKGIETLSVWLVPFRFLDSLWKGGRLAPSYCLFGLLGIGLLLRRSGLNSQAAPDPERDRRRVLGKVIVLWFVALYLEYACTPQGFKGGWHPLIRDADRFLCGLVVPASILAGVGFCTLVQSAGRCRRWPKLLGHPALLTTAGLALLFLNTSRSFFDIGFVPEMRSYMRSKPPGTKIFTHEAMRAIAFLVDARTAGSFVWAAPNMILEADPALEKLASESDEFWYAHKLLWLETRKELEKSHLGQQKPLGSFLEKPERDWVMTSLLAKGDTPDLIFYRRRTPLDPPPQVFGPTDPEFNQLIPSLPFEWKPSNGMAPHAQWAVPPSFRGKFARIELDADSRQVEALSVRLRFFHGKALGVTYLLKPYLHPETGKEFFAFQIPADAEQCEAMLRFSKQAKLVHFVGFRALLQDANAQRAQ